MAQQVLNPTGKFGQLFHCVWHVPATRIIEITENYGHGVGEILPPKDGPDDVPQDRTP
jgi:hypothetical protein